MLIEQKLHIALEDVLGFVADFIKKLEPFKINKDKLFDIKLCLSEALINAVKYGNKMDKNKPVLLKLAASVDSVKIEVKDQGSGFDWNSLPSPIDNHNLDKLTGRGVFLIKNLMDKVEFSDGGSRIRMVKYLKKGKVKR
ncbi:ATP-binding protein [Candidatus Omnitrophota bacterium]